MSNVVRVRFPKIYKPLDEHYRYKIMYGGRGSAKSWTVARKLLLLGAKDKPIRVLCTRELQKSIKQSVHKLLTDQMAAMGLSSFYNATDSIIRGANGTEFIFLGVKHNTDEIKSTEGVDICWIEEGQNLTESSWDIIDPTIRKDGSEIWVTYNTRFKFDHLHSMFVVNKPPPGSWVQLVNHDDNPFFPEPLRIQMETMRERDYEKYLHIWEGMLKQLAEGAIFGGQITAIKKEGRHLYIPIQKNCIIDTFSDLGKNDQTAFWFMQRVGMEHRFIDYFEGRLEEVEYYTRFLKATGYLFGTHYLPHDADHDRLGMTRNIREQFEDGGISPIVVVDRTPDKMTAIQSGREFMARCFFHKADDKGRPDKDCEGYVGDLPNIPDEMATRAKRMERGFDALCNYRFKYNDENDVYQQKPHHDWASNGADAYLQYAQGYDEPTRVKQKTKKRRSWKAS